LSSVTLPLDLKISEQFSCSVGAILNSEHWVKLQLLFSDSNFNSFLFILNRHSLCFDQHLLWCFYVI